MDYLHDLQLYIVFIGFWCYFGIHSILFVSNAFVLFFLTLSLIFKSLRDLNSLDFKTQFYGTLWYFFYYGLSPLCALLLYNITQFSISSNNNNNTLQLQCYFNITCISLSILLSLIYFTRIAIFIHEVNKASAVQNISPAPNNANSAHKVSGFETEETNTYFVMISPTYFRPLHDKLAFKNSSRLEQIKRALSSTQAGLESKINNATHYKDLKSKGMIHHKNEKPIKINNEIN